MTDTPLEDDDPGTPPMILDPADLAELEAQPDPCGNEEVTP